MEDDKTIKETLDSIDETLKKATEEEVKVNEFIANSIIESDESILKLLSEQNSNTYEKIEKVAKKIEKINLDILKNVLNENDFKEFKKTGKIQFTIDDFELKEEQREQLDKFNGKFISEKILMTIPYLLEGNITNGEQLELFKEDFDYLTKQTEKRTKLLDEYYQLYDDITSTNQKIQKIKNTLLDRLPHTEAFSGDKDKKMIDLSNETIFNKFASVMNDTRQDIDSKTLFELSQRIESEYKISFDYNEENHSISYTFEKDLNFTNQFLDISNPTIQKMQQEIEKLKKENEQLKNEESEEVKQFKPKPIDKVIAFNDKISNNFENLENNQIVAISKTGGKKKSLKDSNIQVYIENGEMTTSKILEPFDKIVLQTIYSVLQENSYFDIQMLRKTMSGISNRNGTKLDDDIDKSVSKLWTTLIQIEIPEDLKTTFKDTDFEWESVKGNLLPLIEFKGKKGGKQVTLYGLQSNSIYYSYIKARGQLQTKDSKLLQIGTATKENVLIVDYLTTRIEDMKHKENSKINETQKENLKNITFDSIWELIESDEDKSMNIKSLNQKRKRRTKDIEEILQNYISIKYIKSYSITKTGFKIEI